MHDFTNLKEEDPLKRMVEKETEQLEYSPMDPPEAYEPPAREEIKYAEMHPFLQSLMDEHAEFVKAIDTFESALVEIRETGISREADQNIRNFFEHFDNHIVRHNRIEEKLLFPSLRQELLASGEHGQGQEALTGVDILSDDHTEFLQLAAVVFNFFALCMRLPDANSRLVVLDAALEHGKDLTEKLKLHIFREDHMVFGQAQRLLKKSDLDHFLAESKKIAH